MKRVAIQGVEASFHDVAVHRFFSEEIEIVPCKSFVESCEKLASCDADYCVMAIENSIAGVLEENKQLIDRFQFRVVGECQLPIHLHLMALPGTELPDVKEIHSHPVAIQQCEDFLKQHATVIVKAQQDTASCAARVRDGQLRSVAVIAGDAVAQHYGLRVLERNIESSKNNYTQFVLLSRKEKQTKP